MGGLTLIHPQSCHVIRVFIHSHTSLINVFVFSAWELAVRLPDPTKISRARLGRPNAPAIPDFGHPTPPLIDRFSACCITSEGGGGGGGGSVNQEKA